MEELFNFEVNTYVPEFLSTQEAGYFEESTPDGKRVYHCSYPNCGKVFKFKSFITRHLTTHSDERPHKCPYEDCKKAFKRSDALEGHIKTHVKQTAFSRTSDDQSTASTRSYATTKPSLYEIKEEKIEAEYYQESQPDVHRQQYPHQMGGYSPKNADWSEENSVTDEKMLNQLLGDEDALAEFLAPPLRFASKLNWETKHPDDTDEEFEMRKEHDGFEVTMNSVLQENKDLKDKLDIYRKLITVFQENKKLQDRLEYPDPDSPPTIQQALEMQSTNMMMEENDYNIHNSNFFDRSESNFLEYLRENELNFF